MSRVRRDPFPGAAAGQVAGTPVEKGDGKGVQNEAHERVVAAQRHQLDHAPVAEARDRGGVGRPGRGRLPLVHARRR